MSKCENAKTYPPTWHGELLLACRKCQKKLKHEAGLESLAKLKKTLKLRNKAHPAHPLHVVNVGCMDLCPSRAVTVCLPQREPVRLRVLRSSSDLEQL